MKRIFFDTRPILTALLYSLILFSTIYAQTCTSPTYNVALEGACDILSTNTTLRSCAPGLGCQNSICVAQNQTSLIPCTTNTDCAILGNYNVITNYAHVCVTRSSDQQKYCRAPISSTSAGFECAANSDCASNDCNIAQRTCNIFNTDVSASCTSNLQCYSGGSDITKRLICSATTTTSPGSCTLRNIAVNAACNTYTTSTSAFFPNSNNCAPNLNCYNGACIAPAELGQTCGVGTSGVRYCAKNAVFPTFCKMTATNAGVCTQFSIDEIGQGVNASCFTGDDCAPGFACNFADTSAFVGSCNTNAAVACNNDNAHVKCKSQSFGGFCKCTSTTSDGTCDESTDGVVNANLCHVQYRTLHACLQNAGCWPQFTGNLTDTASCGAPCSSALRGLICCYARDSSLQIRTNVPAGFDYATCSAQAIFSQVLVYLLLALCLLWIQ